NIVRNNGKFSLPKKSGYISSAPLIVRTFKCNSGNFQIKSGISSSIKGPSKNNCRTSCNASAVSSDNGYLFGFEGTFTRYFVVLIGVGIILDINMYHMSMSELIFIIGI